MCRRADMGADSSEKLTVFYDGACPKCVKDRETYERLAGKKGVDVCWFDITGEDQHLRAIGVDPHRALRELHVKDASGQLHTEIDAYTLLFSRIPLLSPLASLIGLPLLRSVLGRVYRWQVGFRLWRSGRG